MKVIIFPNGGGIAVIVPASQKNITVVALKDVPYSVPFKIVDAKDLPGNRENRASWTADFGDPDGYGEDFGVGSDWSVVRYDRAGNPKCLMKSFKDGKKYRLDAEQIKNISTKDIELLNKKVQEKGNHNLRAAAKNEQ